MKNPRTKKPQTQKGPGNDRGRREPPNMSVSWGRGASAWRPGLLIKKHFEEHPETCCADAYYSLSQQIESLNKERVEIGERPFRRPNYSSFSRYFWWFVVLGLVEPVDRYEAAIYPFLRQRHFYRLTDKGKVEIRAWEDPITVRHPELR